MTGYTVHTGTSEKFSSGWDKIFGKKKSGEKAAAKQEKQKPAKRKQSAKSVKKKSRR